MQGTFLGFGGFSPGTGQCSVKALPCTCLKSSFAFPGGKCGDRLTLGVMGKAYIEIMKMNTYKQRPVDTDQQVLKGYQIYYDKK